MKPVFYNKAGPFSAPQALKILGEYIDLAFVAMVFPDGELVPGNITLHHAEEVGFKVRDVESLRQHYALTLRQRVRRLESQYAQVLRQVNEPTYRYWRLYMAGSAHNFAVSRLNLYQNLLVKPDWGTSGLSLTLSFWYVSGR